MEYDEEESTITLDDGTVWTIPVGEITKVLCWIPTSSVIIERNVQRGYPYRIINLGTEHKESVEATPQY